MKLLLIPLFVISCTNYSGEINIMDASKDTLVIVNSSKESPSVLSLKIVGELDSDASINSVVIPKGKVNTKILLDSYSKETEIKYEHKQVGAGHLIIRYRY